MSLANVRVIFGPPSDPSSLWLNGTVSLQAQTVTVVSPPNQWCSLADAPTCVVPVYVSVVPGQEFEVPGGYTYYDPGRLFPEPPFPLQGPFAKTRNDALTVISVRSPSVGYWMRPVFSLVSDDAGTVDVVGTVVPATHEVRGVGWVVGWGGLWGGGCV